MVDDKTRGESSGPPYHDPGIPGCSSPHTGTRHTRGWFIAGIVVAAATLLVYWPTLSFGFVGWDDNINLMEFQAVASPDGLTTIWSSLAVRRGIPNYPMFYTSLWLDFRIWGGDPGGYHATNVILHIINALLVMFLLRSLGASRAVAWVGALLFSLHPMQIESVAWITERKNVLSGVFFLVAFLLYLRFLRSRKWAIYLLSFLAFAAALMSKTSSVTLVASLFLADYFVLNERGRKTARSVSRGAVRLLPFAVAGIVATILLINAEGRPIIEVSMIDRVLTACAAVWFYIAKLLFPVDLIPIYPRWSVDAAALVWWLPLIGAVLAALALRQWRAAAGGVVLWGVMHFVAALLPMLGLLAFGYNDYSFVADRYVYLSCFGLFLALLAGIERGLTALRRGRGVKYGIPLAGIAIAALLGALTWHQIPVWKNSFNLWSYTVEKNPSSWTAQNNYGTALHMKGEYEEALSHWREAVRIQPHFPTSQMRIATELNTIGDLDGAEECLLQVIRDFPKNPMVPMHRALLADVLAAKGRFPQAVRMLQETLQAAPSCVLAVDRLAWIYATSPKPGWRNGSLALRLAKQAVMMTGGMQAETLDTLAAAHAELGRFDLAVELARKAIEQAERAGNVRLVDVIQERLALYINRTPYRRPVNRIDG